ncbi:HisA/HisF-related TIM barrel protein, partial [Candidatus Pelagibacter sp.]|nr:HisA/HisF-related TIM barrel protein [Candidatus Pelagibacter sp.]
DSFDEFCEVLKKMTREIFVPVSAGGGINDIHRAKKILRSGSDKIILNSIALNEPNQLDKYINFFGSQCIIISLDLIRNKNNVYNIWDNNEKIISKVSLESYFIKINKHNFGEIYLTSIDKDGTGQGYDFKMLESLKYNILTPIIISGGAGNWKHLYEGLLDERVDAVSTANLLNFVDKGLINSRNNILAEGFDLPIWASLNKN